MKKIAKLALSVFLLATILSSKQELVLAATKTQTSISPKTEIKTPKQKVNTSKKVIDYKKINKYNMYNEKYKDTTYIFKGAILVKRNALPYSNVTQIISVPRGGSVSLTTKKEVTGTVKTSASASTDLMGVVNIGLGLEVSGSISQTWEKNMKFNGPAGTSKSNTREYYGAVGYDQYDVKVLVIDNYEMFQGKHYIATKSYQRFQTIKTIYVPKIISYSIDYTIK